MQTQWISKCVAPWAPKMRLGFLSCCCAGLHDSHLSHPGRGWIRPLQLGIQANPMALLSCNAAFNFNIREAKSKFVVVGGVLCIMINKGPK